jgi:hypothetical protein
MAQRTPDPAVVFADCSLIFCIEFMANAAVVCVQPKAYHFRMEKCTWKSVRCHFPPSIPLTEFLRSC